MIRCFYPSRRLSLWFWIAKIWGRPGGGLRPLDPIHTENSGSKDNPCMYKIVLRRDLEWVLNCPNSKSPRRSTPWTPDRSSIHPCNPPRVPKTGHWTPSMKIEMVPEDNPFTLLYKFDGHLTRRPSDNNWCSFIYDHQRLAPINKVERHLEIIYHTACAYGFARRDLHLVHGKCIADSSSHPTNSLLSIKSPNEV